MRSLLKALATIFVLVFEWEVLKITLALLLIPSDVAVLGAFLTLPVGVAVGLWILEKIYIGRKRT